MTLRERVALRDGSVDMAASPHGKWLAAAGGTTVKLWNVATGRERASVIHPKADSVARQVRFKVGWDHGRGVIFVAVRREAAADRICQGHRQVCQLQLPDRVFVDRGQFQRQVVREGARVNLRHNRRATRRAKCEKQKSTGQSHRHRIDPLANLTNSDEPRRFGRVQIVFSLFQSRNATLSPSVPTT